MRGLAVARPGLRPSARRRCLPFISSSPGYRGITLINIGIGPSNARNVTDHVAVLRPHAWLMVGHCAGLRNTQRLGDYVLAHGYVREDQRARPRAAALGPDPGAGRDAGRAGGGGRRGYRADRL
jgi:nucleoside phosphorylase